MQTFFPPPPLLNRSYGHINEGFLPDLYAPSPFQAQKRAKRESAGKFIYLHYRVAAADAEGVKTERDPNLYLVAETSFQQDMITTSFDEQWATPISRAKSAESQ